jgi:hypothetical protein
MASKQNQPEATAGITVDFLQSVPLFSNMSRTEIEQVIFKGRPLQRTVHYRIRTG